MKNRLIIKHNNDAFFWRLSALHFLVKIVKKNCQPTKTDFFVLKNVFLKNKHTKSIYYPNRNCVDRKLKHVDIIGHN